METQTLRVHIAGDHIFTTNCYIVSAEPQSSSVIVIDPGDEADRILEMVGERTIEGIILTHGHFDHMGAVPELLQVSGAKLYAHEFDAQRILSSLERIRDSFIEYLESKQINSLDLSTTVPEVDIALDEGDVLEICGLELRVLHTPGHSEGSICLYEENKGVLFSGDTLFYGTCGRTDFEGGSPARMRDSLARLSQLPPETVVLPGHDRSTTIGEEIARGLSEY